ncbi:hypothetical protein BDY24DRAFT_384359 [Mrakia frigida]|uniref:uncharacterized protein n=1 Tax=Mrakia frigida TaxID=29902 RepID=UPI003FCBFC2C
MVGHPLVLLLLQPSLKLSEILGGVDGVEEKDGFVQSGDVRARRGGVDRPQLRLGEEEEAGDLSSDVRHIVMVLAGVVDLLVWVGRGRHLCGGRGVVGYEGGGGLF